MTDSPLDPWLDELRCCYAAIRTYVYATNEAIMAWCNKERMNALWSDRPVMVSVPISRYFEHCSTNDGVCSPQYCDIDCPAEEGSVSWEGLSQYRYISSIRAHDDYCICFVWKHVSRKVESCIDRIWRLKMRSIIGGLAFALKVQ